MKRVWINLVIGLMTSFLLEACAPSTTPTTTSNNSPPHASQTTARRVVTLTPLTTDIIAQLDAARLVGVPGSRLIKNNPQFQKLPLVTAERTPPNLEKIVALKPDLVVGAAGFHDQALGKLQGLGIKTITTKVDSWKALQELTIDLARSLNVNPAPLLKRYQTFISDIPPSDLTTLILVSRQPILSPNKTSWTGDLLKQFKIKNLTADLQGDNPLRGYVTLSPEKILKQNPEAILVVENGDKALEKFRADSYWQQLKAVKSDRVYPFDYYGLVNPGSIDSIEKACEQLRKIASSS
jgi:iron complex transport system substrate-binding protein